MQLDSKTILCMLANEFGLKRDNTEERLKLQKTIYLLQANGLQLGYGFSWYKYGPYSQDLVTDAYRALYSEKAEYEEKTKDLKFSENSSEKFDKFRETCRDILNDPEQLELVASVDFFRKTWHPDKTGEEFTRLFKKKKGKLFGGTEVVDEMINKALSISKKLRVAAA